MEFFNRIVTAFVAWRRKRFFQRQLADRVSQIISQLGPVIEELEFFKSRMDTLPVARKRAEEAEVALNAAMGTLEAVLPLMSKSTARQAARDLKPALSSANLCQAVR